MVEVDDVRSMHAQKAIGIESLLELDEREVHQMASSSRDDGDIVVCRFEPLNVAHEKRSDLGAPPHEQPCHRLRVLERSLRALDRVARRRALEHATGAMHSRLESRSTEG